MENAVLHALSLASDIIYPEYLPARIRQFFDTTSSKMPETPVNSAEESENWLPLSDIEAKYVAKVLPHTGGNKQAAARLLQIDRKTPARIIKRNETTNGD